MLGFNIRDHSSDKSLFNNQSNSIPYQKIHYLISFYIFFLLFLASVWWESLSQFHRNLLLCLHSWGKWPPRQYLSGVWWNRDAPDIALEYSKCHPFPPQCLTPRPWNWQQLHRMDKVGFSRSFYRPSWWIPVLFCADSSSNSNISDKQLSERPAYQKLWSNIACMMVRNHLLLWVKATVIVWYQHAEGIMAAPSAQKGTRCVVFVMIWFFFLKKITWEHFLSPQLFCE